MTESTDQGQVVAAGPQPGEGTSVVNPDVVKAVVGAYYPAIIGSADSARTRAQSAYAIANALAGGLVGASLLTVFSNAPTATKAVGFFAVGVWIASSALYVYAIASPLPTTPPSVQATGTAFVDRAMDLAKESRAEVDRRQRRANIGALIAVVFTSLSFGLLLFGPTARVDASIYLTSTGSKQIAAICGKADIKVAGKVTTASLGSTFLVVTIPAGKCQSGQVTIQIPATSVSGVTT